MIQRKQSLYLLVAVVCLILMKFVPFGNQAINNELGAAQLKPFDAGTTLPIVLCSAAAVILSTVAIFLYKKRNVQKLLVLISAVVCITLCVLEYLHCTSATNSTMSFGMVLPLIAGFANLLAYRGIVADEKLIRSLDRMRD
jgi:hypothetical protein